MKRATASRLVKAGVAMPLATGSLDAPIEAPLRRRVTIGFIVAVLLTIFIGFSSWRGARRAEQDAYWVSHTHEVMEAIQRTTRHLIETETSARAFALTGEEPLLASYQTARDSLDRDEDALRHLTADNLSQRRRLDVLESEVRTALEFGESIIAKRRKLQAYPGGSDALEIERLIEVVRATTRDMYAEETRLLGQRTQRAQAGQRLTRITAVVGIFVGLGLWVLAKLAVNREINVSSRARAQLSTLNGELEQRVEQRTAALRASEEWFRLLLDGVKDYAIYMLDPEGHVISWNAGAARIKGFQSEEILGKDFSCFYKAEDIEAGKPARDLQESVAQGRFEEEARRVRKDGSIFWANVVITPMYDGSGTLRGFSKVARDISERKQAEERLTGQTEELSRQTEELLRSQQALENETRMLQSVLNSMAEGLVATDEQGKFIIWNPAAAKILGMGATNLPSLEWTAHYGLFLEDTVTPFPTDQLPLARAIRGEASTAQIFVRNPEVDPGTWIEASGGPLKDKDGAVRGGVVAFRDVTQRRADEREIRKLNEELEERVAQRTAQLEAANKELEAFTYSVSHDLRAPLRHIGGFSRILIEDFAARMEPEARAHLQRIEEGSHRMGLLVDELLNLARVGRHALKLQVVSLNSVVEEVVSMLQPEVAGRTVNWKIAKLPSAECDPILIKQVFQNLLANALKFTRTRERAVIEISYRQENGEMVIAISDNGVGFNMRYKDKLFGVFQRLHRAEEFEGTGIGLATVQRIVHKHGGRVWAEGELDRGATFFFTLGAAASTQVKPEDLKANEAENKSAAAGGQV